MATYFARASGNVNGAIWATTPAGVAGSVTFDPADVLLANSFSVTLNVNIQVAEVRNDTTGGATTGGSFFLSTGVTLTAAVPGTGSVNCVVFNLSTAATITGNIFGASVVNLTSGAVLHSGSGTLTINGNVTGPTVNTTNSSIGISGSGTLIVNGNVSNTGSGDNVAIRVITTNGSSIIINGAVTATGGNSAVSIAAGSSLAVNIGPITNLSPSSSNTIFYGSPLPATINCPVVGPFYGSNITGSAFNNGSTGLVTFNGTITGGTGAGSSAAAVLNSSTGTVVVNSTVTGDVGPGIRNTSTGVVTINGTVIGGVSNGAGVINTGAGAVTITGTAVGGVSGPGVINSSVGRVTVTRAKGNAFGIGSTGLTGQVGVSNTSTGFCVVSELEYGDRGMSPTAGPIIMLDQTSNVALLYRSGLAKQTLIDANTTASLLPAATDTRKGVVYNAGNNVGTMNVPAAASTALGVSVDNTTGTAALTAAAILDELTSNARVAGSFGERLKVVSTVATTGQQLADALG